MPGGAVESALAGMFVSPAPLPLKAVAVTVPADKFPLASRFTIVFGVTFVTMLTQALPFRRILRLLKVTLGANDALRGLSIQESNKNLRKMIQMSKQSGAKVLLFGMQIPPNYGQEYAREFKDLYGKLASQENVQLLPFFLSGVASDINLFQADRIHPNEKAQTILFKNVWGAMAPYQTILKGN